MLALRKLRAIGRDQQRQVRKLRRLGAESLEDQNMLERIRQVILAAHDVADAQVGVIGTGGQVIGRRAVAAQKGEVLDVGGLLGLVSVDAVVKANVASGFARNSEAPHERLAGSRAPIAFLTRQFTHAGVKKPRSAGAGFFAFVALSRREVPVGGAFPGDDFGRFPVQLQALRLAILLVPAELEPVQPVEDGIERSLRIPANVGVVDPQDHRPVVPACV